MSKKCLELKPLAGFAGVHVLRSGRLGCTAIGLRGGGICIYSPLPHLAEAEFAALASLGEVSILLAPNHYHHRGIAQHLDRFAHASPVCTPGARPRLQKLTGLDFKGPGALSGKLPPNVRLLEPEGLKTGEVWLEIAGENGLAWIVCDGFSSDESARTPTMLATFPKFGIRDRVIYESWVTSQIDQRPPTTLVPCHGIPVAPPDLSARLGALVSGRA